MEVRLFVGMWMIALVLDCAPQMKRGKKENATTKLPANGNALIFILDLKT
jgi:hypothetical protein